MIKSVCAKNVLMLCAAAMLVGACGREQGADEAATAEAQQSGKVPVTTASDEARDLYLQGLSMFDSLLITEANALFREAVETDPGFARAWFMLAQSALSAAEFFDAVDKARANAANASAGEQRMIEALVAGAENDQDGQLVAWNDLLDEYPDDERTARGPSRATSRGRSNIVHQVSPNDSRSPSRCKPASSRSTA